MKRRDFLASAGSVTTPAWLESTNQPDRYAEVRPYLPADIMVWAKLNAGWLREHAEDGTRPSAYLLRSSAKRLESLVDLWEQAFFGGNPPICAKGHKIVGDNVRLSSLPVRVTEDGGRIVRPARTCRRCYLSLCVEDEGIQNGISPERSYR